MPELEKNFSEVNDDINNNVNSVLLNLSDIAKKGIGLFPDEQELVANYGLFFDSEIHEHFEYFNFDETILKNINDELFILNQTLQDPTLIDSIEQFWFAHKSGSVLDKTVIVHLFKNLPKDLPIAELYVVFVEDYLSFQIVFMPNTLLPHLSSLMFVQNENIENKDIINTLINRFNLLDTFNTIKSMKI